MEAAGLGPEWGRGLLLPKTPALSQLPPQCPAGGNLSAGRSSQILPRRRRSSFSILLLPQRLPVPREGTATTTHSTLSSRSRARENGKTHLGQALPQAPPETGRPGPQCGLGDSEMGSPSHCRCTGAEPSYATAPRERGPGVSLRGAAAARGLHTSPARSR